PTRPGAHTPRLETRKPGSLAGLSVLPFGDFVLDQARQRLVAAHLQGRRQVVLHRRGRVHLAEPPAPSGVDPEPSGSPPRPTPSGRSPAGRAGPPVSPPAPSCRRAAMLSRTASADLHRRRWQPSPWHRAGASAPWDFLANASCPAACAGLRACALARLRGA